MSDYPREEIRSAAFRSELLYYGFPRLGFVFLAFLVRLLWVAPFGIILTPLTWAVIFTSVTLLILIGINRRTNRTMEMVEDIIEGRTTVTELVDEYGIESPDLVNTLLRMNENSDVFERLVDAKSGDEMAKVVDEWGSTIYRTRGKDPKGPAKGKGADTIATSLTRVDGLTPRPEFEVRQASLTNSEVAVEEANVVAAEESQKRWKRSESSDPELIEAGVDKLGDLVGSGHFGGPGKPHE